MVISSSFPQSTSSPPWSFSEASLQLPGDPLSSTQIQAPEKIQNGISIFPSSFSTKVWKKPKREVCAPWQNLCQALKSFFRDTPKCRFMYHLEKLCQISTKVWRNASKSRFMYLDRNCAISISVKKPKRRAHLLQLCSRKPRFLHFHIFVFFSSPVFQPWTCTHPQSCCWKKVQENTGISLRLVPLTFPLFSPSSLSNFVSAA